MGQILDRGGKMKKIYNHIVGNNCTFLFWIGIVIDELQSNRDMNKFTKYKSTRLFTCSIIDGDPLRKLMGKKWACNLPEVYSKCIRFWPIFRSALANECQQIKDGFDSKNILSVLKLAASTMPVQIAHE